MTSKEAAERIETYIAATDADGTPWIKALRLAVGALEREARRLAAMPWRCQHCALLDVSCFGSNEECNGFEERA
jgi:hypothetical protein